MPQLAVAALTAARPVPRPAAPQAVVAPATAAGRRSDRLLGLPIDRERKWQRYRVDREHIEYRRFIMPNKYRQVSGGGDGAKKRTPKTTATGDQHKGKAAPPKGKAAPPKKRYPDTIRSPRSRTEKFAIGVSEAVNKLGPVGSALAGAVGAGSLAPSPRAAAARAAARKAAQNYQRTLKKK